MKIVIATVMLSVLAACMAPPRDAGHEQTAVVAPQPAVIAQTAVAQTSAADDTAVASIPLAHARPEQAVHDLQQLMSGWTHCRFVANAASNTIVVVGPAAEIQTLRDVIANLDTPPQPGAAAR